MEEDPTHHHRASCPKSTGFGIRAGPDLRLATAAALTHKDDCIRAASRDCPRHRIAVDCATEVGALLAGDLKVAGEEVSVDLVPCDVPQVWSRFQPGRSEGEQDGK